VAHDAHEELLEEATRTPAWLPLLGLAIFFAAAVWLVLDSDGPDVVLQPPPAAEPAAAE
jgi:hypothetical protein